MNRILVADDELSMREFLDILLTKEGYAVDTAEDGARALQMIEKANYDMVICDMMMPGATGMDVLKRARELDPEALVIVITAFASTDSAVEAMKLGAYDYITKPFQVDEIKLIVKKAIEKNRLLRENILLRREVESRYIFDNIVGSSVPMQAVFEMIRKVAPTRSNVLIAGESGTGKELAAKAIHYNSERKDKPFVTVNCGAIPSELLESELFGHLKGAFTGAYTNKRGLFEVANEGSIFLDEIGETPLPIQVKLLRAIQDKTFKPVGGVEDVKVDVRVLAATNVDIEEAVKQGRFREDLYYRLNVIQIRMPSLKERPDDVLLLARHFMEIYSREIGKKVDLMSEEAEKILTSYEWPGNVRELENTIERAISIAGGNIITPEELPDRVRHGGGPCGVVGGVPFPEKGIDLENVLQRIETELIEEALRRSGKVKKKAADLLGVSFRSFRYRMEKLGIEGGED